MTDKIAIIAWGAMADVLYATPIVKYVRQQHPDAEITWLVRDKFAEVVETNPHIDQVKTFSLPEGHKSRQDAEYVMDRDILAYAKANFDKVIDLQYWPRYANFYEIPTEDFVSLRARNAGLDATAIKDRDVVMQPTEEDIQTAREFVRKHDLTGRPYITINHISYAATPVCSFDYYQQLVKLAEAEGMACVFTGATNEPIPEGGIDARGLSYRVWYCLIAMSDLYLGLDSGAKTLACATETPMIILHSRDFSLKKTGCVSMGIRRSGIIELTTIPTPSSLFQVILSNVQEV